MRYFGQVNRVALRLQRVYLTHLNNHDLRSKFSNSIRPQSNRTHTPNNIALKNAPINIGPNLIIYCQPFTFLITETHSSGMDGGILIGNLSSDVINVDPVYTVRSTVAEEGKNNPV